MAELDNKTCSECEHFTTDNKCGDTSFLINRNPTDAACSHFKEVV